MGEIKLTCPGCGAEYKLPSGAIPPEGREVECSACNKVWMARAGQVPARPTTPTPPRTIPATGQAGPDQSQPLSRRVPADVLSILREEVEHERRIRAAEAGIAPSAPEPARSPSEVEPEPEWPATTVTTLTGPEQEPPRRAARTSLSIPRLPETEDAPIEAPATAPEVPQVPDNASPSPVPLAVAGEARAQIANPVPQPAPALHPAPAATAPLPDAAPAAKPHVAASGYRMGFGLAAMIAACGLALYLLAPSMQGSGDVGDGLMAFRDQVDAGRAWLAAQVSAN